jgi:hypothetical protein
MTLKVHPHVLIFKFIKAYIIIINIIHKAFIMGVFLGSVAHLVIETRDLGLKLAGSIIDHTGLV